ncbi:unnamed protein product [Candidula unifasciata]|uniref:Torsin-1A-interacting protein 1/2 AAA+ activator domain-containing protein n=1 Tax=Candidula unifasciata TaxID=100452 RepID=A0A8S3Z0I9_9EUPU|nr:unnamed protein product [Candidula unifasciata]
MARPKSPREVRRRQKADDTYTDSDGSSEGENSHSRQDDDRSNNSHRNTSSHKYLNVSSRSDLSHHSDLNSSAETHRHTSRSNTSTSSEADSLDRASDRNASKSPRMYPSLKGFYESEQSSVDSPQEVPSKNTSSWLPLCVVLGILLGIAIFLYLNQSSVEPSSADGPVPPFHRFTGHVSSLEQLLPNQNKRLWKTIKASTKHVLNDADSDYPVVILMASPTKYERISKCIAKKITENFQQSLGLAPAESVADVGRFRHLDPPLQKQKLDEYLHLTFSDSQKKSFVIDNLQLLHPEAALMLHGYCDNDNAPYKDVMMVLLLYVDEHKVMDYSSASIESYLEQLWSQGLEIDKVKALLSRVANNIVTVEMEDEDTLSKVCS